MYTNTEWGKYWPIPSLAWVFIVSSVVFKDFIKSLVVSDRDERDSVYTLREYTSMRTH